jgi:DNA-binding transcriptional ArsR family regulator
VGESPKTGSRRDRALAPTGVETGFYVPMDDAAVGLSKCSFLKWRSSRVFALREQICNARITCVGSDAAPLRLVELEDETAPLWRALADPTRRRIMDLLRERPRVTGEIASHFEISRIAVMRHLEVLEEAQLTTSRKRGRERWHYLNAVPLRRLHERWFDPVVSGWAFGLLRLQDRVEARAGRMRPSEPDIDVALDVMIAGTPAAVFSALTRDPGGWWGPPFLGSQATGLTLERRIGGLFLEQWDDGGEVVAAVTGWQDDRYLKLTGPFHHGVAMCIATFDLEPVDQGTLLRFTFRAVGAIDADTADAMSKGWTELLATRLKTLVETGTRLGIAADPPPTPIRARHEGGTK